MTNKNEIDQALDLAAKIMNSVYLHYENQTIRYEPYPGSADGEHLIAHLQRYANLLDQTNGD